MQAEAPSGLASLHASGRLQVRGCCRGARCRFPAAQVLQGLGRQAAHGYWDERDDGSAEVHLSIYVAREGHRGIILGKGGQTMRRIGTAARKDLETALDRRIHLFAHIKYRNDWMNDSARYSIWDLDYNA